MVLYRELDKVFSERRCIEVRTILTSIYVLPLQENLDDIDDDEGSGDQNKTGMVAKLIDTKKKRQTIASGKQQLYNRIRHREKHCSLLIYQNRMKTKSLRTL